MEHLHQESKVCIGPTSGEFTPGFQIEGHARVGTEYDTEVSHMSDECKKAAVVFGLKLSLTNADVGAAAVETLNQLKDMAMGVDQVKEIVDKGLDITFRHEGLFVFINVRIPETLPELQGIPGWNQVDLSKVSYSGKHDFKVTSGADPTKFLTATLDEILERASHFSVNGEGSFEELHHVITAAVELARQMLPDVPEVRTALTAVQIFTAFRSLKFEFKYDATVVRNVIKNVIESSGKLEKLTGKIQGNQELANGFLPQAQMMAPMFIGPYADLLKSVNLGHYEFFVMVPRLRLYLNPGFTLFGLNAFVNDNFLNQ
jgi:hypothetical protein